MSTPSHDFPSVCPWILCFAFGTGRRTTFVATSWNLVPSIVRVSQSFRVVNLLYNVYRSVELPGELLFRFSLCVRHSYNRLCGWNCRKTFRVRYTCIILQTHVLLQKREPGRFSYTYFRRCPTTSGDVLTPITYG